MPALQKEGQLPRLDPAPKGSREKQQAEGQHIDFNCPGLRSARASSAPSRRAPTPLRKGQGKRQLAASLAAQQAEATAAAVLLAQHRNSAAPSTVSIKELGRQMQAHGNAYANSQKEKAFFAAQRNGPGAVAATLATGLSVPAAALCRADQAERGTLQVGHYDRL